MDMNDVPIVQVPDGGYLKSCDHCKFQEGRHHCLLRGKPVKNMDAVTCGAWEEHPDSDMEPHTKTSDAIDNSESGRTEQLRNELRSVIQRWGEESNLTVCETLGVLELIKAEWIERLRRS